MPRTALLDQAFGRNLVEGTDEWSHVDDVVRTALFLLYKEVRKSRNWPPSPSCECQDAKLLLLKLNDAVDESHRQWELVRAQVDLLDEQVRMWTTTVRQMRKAEVVHQNDTKDHIRGEVRHQCRKMTTENGTGRPLLLIDICKAASDE